MQLSYAIKDKMTSQQRMKAIFFVRTLFEWTNSLLCSHYFCDLIFMHAKTQNSTDVALSAL